MFMLITENCRRKVFLWTRLKKKSQLLVNILSAVDGLPFSVSFILSQLRVIYVLEVINKTRSNVNILLFVIIHNEQ